MCNKEFYEKNNCIKMKPIMETNKTHVCKICCIIKQNIFQCHTCYCIYCDQCWDIYSHCIQCKWKLNKNTVINKIPKQTCFNFFRKIIKYVCCL